LAFARVFLKDPDVVVLDEASSRLDPATERLIERAIDKLLQNRTAIIIAHRLTTVQRADEIMILERGRYWSMTACCAGYRFAIALRAAVGNWDGGGAGMNPWHYGLRIARSRPWLFQHQF
jgi:energy-coupling factor transporter ATP-binding protein EcfA2